MTEVAFIKMHGIGNDYLLINGFSQAVGELGDPARLARQMSDRHFGVGADGLILLLPVDRGAEGDVRMRMFNADGSEAEMCGNGIRCLCKLAHDDGVCRSNPMRVRTGAGVLTLEYELDDANRVSNVTVDMGRPVPGRAEIPVVGSELTGEGEEPRWKFGDDGAEWVASFVSMGNPHVVFFRETADRSPAGALDDLDIARWGPVVEHHRAFPRRINAHWVHVSSRREMAMRTWERGSGETLGCGTGAAAACAAGAISGRTDRNVRIHLPGGDLRLDWRHNDDHMHLTGPAVEVFRGTWDLLAARSGC